MPGAGGSHSSPQAASMIPSPQRKPDSIMQVDEQPSQSLVLPSSHCSAPHTTPSPQPVTSVQLLLHVSQSLVLPSSHCSPGSTLPSPQNGMCWHWASHWPATGGSHCSPQAMLMIPSPQRSPLSVVQVTEQPSQLVVLPSSHSSAPHTTPSPQPVTSVQVLLHPSQLSVLPSSHSSPGSTTPLPHTEVFGGSAILMNLPRPLPSFTSGSSDLQVHGLPSGSKMISRMKLPRVGTG